MSSDDINGIDDAFNDTLPILSEEEDLAHNTFNQSSDSMFRVSSASSLFIPNSRKGQHFSTPKKSRVQKGKPSRSSASRIHKCNICGVSLKTLKGLDRHLHNHNLEERARRKPTPHQLIENCVSDGCQITRQLEEASISEDLCGNSFTTFASNIRESAFSEPNSQFRNFVEVCVKPLAKSLHISKSVLPSAIRTEVRNSLHSFLADTNIRSARLEALVGIAGGPINIAEQYLGEFCKRLVHSTLSFFIKQMREAADDQHVVSLQKFSEEDVDSFFSQQTLHNVAGYSVKAVLLRCRQYRKSPRWRDIQRVVLDRFAHVGTMEARPGERTFLTALLGRKSYTFVSEAAFEFFVEVAKVICYTETCEGNLSKEAVLQNVLSNPFIISKWGNLIGSTLSDSDSMFLMRLLVLSVWLLWKRYSPSKNQQGSKTE